ncbi:MAG: hypothetical protein AAFY77_07185 [Pseudomonadota bacterium]
MPQTRLVTLIALVLAAGAVTVGIAALASPMLGTGAGLISIAFLAAALALKAWPR